MRQGRGGTNGPANGPEDVQPYTDEEVARIVQARELLPKDHPLHPDFFKNISDSDCRSIAGNTMSIPVLSAFQACSLLYVQFDKPTNYLANVVSSQRN